MFKIHCLFGWSGIIVKIFFGGEGCVCVCVGGVDGVDFF